MRVYRPVLAAVSALALALAGTVVFASPAAAADGVVTSTVDDNLAGSLRYEIVNSDPGDTITFDPAVFGTAQTITLNGALGAIAINHSLTVQGPGSGLLTVTRGADLTVYDMFSVGPSVESDIVFSGITLSRTPSVTQTGSAFRSSDDEVRDLTLTDVVFENQLAFYGAGLYVETVQRSLTITDSVFRDNAAIVSGGGSYVATSGAVTLTNVTFHGNDADQDGGGAYLQQIGALLVQGSVFTQNTTGGNGGAISAVGAPSVYVSDSEFGSVTDSLQANEAGLRGGALYFEEILGPVDIVECGFDDNHTTAGDVTSIGGALSTDSTGSVGIAASEFRENAARVGGAVYLEDLAPDATVTVFASLFELNAADFGGGLYVTEVPVSALLLDSTFRSNETDAEGGAVAINAVLADANFTVRGSTFERNSATALDGDGAAIWVGTNSEVVEVDRSTFFGQLAADGDGASLFLDTNNGELRVLNSTFDEHADDDSGAIYLNAQGELGRTDILSSTLVGAWRPFEVDSNRGVTELVNSIFSAPAGVPAVATGGEEIDATSSLFSSAYDSGVITSVATNRFSIADMKLAPLALNGGAVLNRLPLVGSPARDAGDSQAAYVATTPNDQRGDGFPRLIGGAIDIGAIEVQPVLAATGQADWLPFAVGGALVLLLGAAALGYRATARRSG